MPVTPTYPGVYIEEIPSGVRTIVGVATSMRDTKNITTDVAHRFGITREELFNLTIEEKVNGKTLRIEQFHNLSTADKSGSRRADRVLEAESELVRALRKSDGTLDVVPASPALPAAGGTTGSPAAEGTTGGAVAPGNPAAGASTSPATTAGGTNIALTPSTIQTNGANSDLLTALSDYVGKETDENNRTGLHALDRVDLFNLLCIPLDDAAWTPPAPSGPNPTGPAPEPQAYAIYQAAMKYCSDRRAMLIVDPPSAWSANKDAAASTARDSLDKLGLNGEFARNAVLYFPRVIQPDPFNEGRPGTFPPCGIIAGVFARTDATRGVWKAPAGLDASLNGIQALEVDLNDGENGMLNQLGINCLRSFRVYGRVVWGARTLRGADQLADEYKYVPVRRTALFIEESLYRGTQWVVFEPNDEPLWSQIRLNVGAFMNSLFRQGAFQGRTPREAYYVKCDRENNPQNDIDRGIVNIHVGFAPLKPAEFVMIQIQQIAGDLQV
ncbi:MAG: phage tail sheath family protein [Dehalococcoidia bacterium]